MKQTKGSKVEDKSKVMPTVQSHAGSRLPLTCRGPLAALLEPNGHGWAAASDR